MDKDMAMAMNMGDVEAGAESTFPGAFPGSTEKSVCVF